MRRGSGDRLRSDSQLLSDAERVEATRGGRRRRRRSSFGEFGATAVSAEVAAVAIAEFHLTEGNTLSTVYPADFAVPGYGREALGNLSVPDGGHLFGEDWTYGILEPDDDNELLFAQACFMTRRDESQARGALQKSLLVLSRVPAFDAFREPMRAALTRFLDSGCEDEGVLAALYAALNGALAARRGRLLLWGARYDFPVPRAGFEPMRFGGVSLARLLERVGERVMVLWYALLLRHRVLVVGHGVAAEEVGQLVLALPLLTPSLVDFVVLPYVSLWDIGRLSASHFIAGTTNKMLGMKTDLFDACVSLESDTVSHQWGIAPAASDLRFVRELLAEVRGAADAESGERLARAGFEAFTARVLQQATEGGLAREHQKYLGDYSSSDSFIRYQLQKPRMSVRRGAEDLTVAEDPAAAAGAGAGDDDDDEDDEDEAAWAEERKAAERPRLRKAASARAIGGGGGKPGLLRQASGRMDRRAMSAAGAGKLPAAAGVRASSEARIQHEAFMAATAASGRVILEGQFRLRDRTTAHQWSPWRDVSVVLFSSGLVRYHGNSDRASEFAGWVDVRGASSVGAAKAHAAERRHSVQVSRSDGQLWVMTPLAPAPADVAARWVEALAEFCPVCVRIAHEGPMAKRGQLNSRWKRRHCVLLSDGELQYYAGETLKGSLQVVQVQSAQAIADSPTQFELVTPQRTWAFDALERAARDVWLLNIARQVKGVETTHI